MVQRRRRAASHRDAQQIHAFLDRCEQFRRLLAANHTALEIMADLGDADGDEALPDMNSLRSNCVGAVAAVGRMVEALCAMSPGRFDALRPSLRRIARDIDAVVNAEDGAAIEGPCILLLEKTANRPDQAGAKAAVLGELRKEPGVSVPPGFVFTANAFHQFMRGGLREEINCLLTASKRSELADDYALFDKISEVIQAAPLPRLLREQLREIAPETIADRFAVRSSALDEDMSGASFAGQYRTVLHVPPEGIEKAYREVVAAAYSPTAVNYRRNRGLGDDGVVMCVACMKMVEARSGGVMYTRDPLGLNGEDVVVHAVSGLPVSIVDGTCDPEIWRIRPETDEIIEAAGSANPFDDKEGAPPEASPPENPAPPALTPQNALELARMARRIEQRFGCPQDVEWAIDDDGIVILQSRPLDIYDEAGDGARTPLPGFLLQGGVTASPGVALGRTHIVRCEEDLFSLPQDAVLVADQADPAWAAALGRVAAVVSERGSPAGHLANVARELHVPAVFGMKGAVRALAGAREVVVDSRACAVYPGAFADRIPVDPPATRPAPEAGPVMRLRRRAMDCILPLTLTDAASPKFVPEECRTLHDITRFCHEKGVNEMFNRPGAAPKGATRRLVTDVPTQYWVLDMGGGVLPSAEKDVTIDQIASTPLLALWEGMTAKEWEGPPPPDPGGFLSVMMEATANPALEAGRGNSMGERNYFIIGEEYCNMQARFGFHFSTVEGHACPFSDENYAYMQFKGGGAGLDRRRRRAVMVRSVLTQQGFTAAAKDDAFFARMENVSAEEILRGLFVLGYIVAHTRQLDMLMSGPDAVEAHARRLLQELDERLPSSRYGALPKGSGSSGDPEGA